MDTNLLLAILLGAAAAAVALFVIARRKAHPNLAHLAPARLAGIAAREAALYCEEHRRSTSEDLDYSEASLKKLDRMLERNFTSNTLDERAITHMGMYLGETIRRLFGGEWKFNEGFAELCLDLPEEGFIFPGSHIRRALEHKESGPLSAYVESIGERQRAAGRGRPAA